jgi:phosphoribosylanthranilate isomerase
VKVKVCGITRPEDAALAVELGADLVGLNFWPGSSRAVTVEQAREAADAIRGRALLAGVFVDQPPSFMVEAAAEVGLDLVQLHGNEPPSTLIDLACAGIGASRVVRALRVGPAFDAGTMLAPWIESWGFLFDADRPGVYGGTGETFPWSRVARAAPGRRVLVAGGIAPGRLRTLLADAGGWRPWGIDVCSGVESAPGRKDAGKLRALFEEIHDVEAPTPA